MLKEFRFLYGRSQPVLFFFSTSNHPLHSDSSMVDPNVDVARFGDNETVHSDSSMVDPNKSESRREKYEIRIQIPLWSIPTSQRTMRPMSGPA